MKISKKITAIMLSLSLAVTMLPGMAFAGEITADNMKHAEDAPSSYGYEETAVDSTTVTVTYSNDGKPLQGFDKDQTDMAHLEVTVPYFDLSLYGLEEYYRYGTDGGQGQYIDTTVIERPTMLHLYIYVAERYYLGLSEDKCGQGNDVSGVMDYMDEMHVKYFDDVDAYSSIDEYDTAYKAFGVSGGACSLYIDSGMWGRSQNLQYYRNHRYPLMSPGWGATADYALLSDGDDVDMGMFSNWNFYMDGRFLAFNRELYTVDPSETMTVTLYATGTSSMGGTEETPVAPDDGTLSVTAALYDSSWNEVSGVTVTDNYDGTFEVTVPETAGTYYLMAMDSNAATENACYAPATAKIIVGDAGNDEAAAALAQAKRDAKAALDEYADASDYREAQQTTLADAITAGKAAIDEAADTDAVAAALADAKAVIDEIPTDAELTAEEEADTPEDKPADKPVDTPADKPVEKHTMKLEKKQYTISSDEPFTVTGSGEFDDFLRVLMDGKVIDPKHYVATEGSTIITFTTAFLDTLEPGEHTIEMVWTTGSVAEDIFIADNKADESAADKSDKVVEIVKSETKTQNESDTEKNSQPETGDQNALALWTILFALGAAGSIAVRRKQN